MDPIIKKNAINFGLIFGAIAVLSTTMMYVIDLKLFVNMWIGFGLIFLYVILGGVQLSKTRRERKGVLSFKEAFTAYFLSSFIGIVISTVFSILLLNVIDTEARDIITEHLLDFQVGMMEKFNAPKAEIEKAIVAIKENSQFSLMGQIKGLFGALLGSAFFGLILAAIFRSKSTQREL